MYPATAAARADEHVPWCCDHSPGPGESRQAVLVVAHPQQPAQQDRCRDPDQPDSKEDQPEGHALPVIAYRELYTACCTSHKTQRLYLPALSGGILPDRAPKRSTQRPRMPISRPSGRSRRRSQGGNRNQKFTLRDWTGGGFWVTSISRASWTPCSRPRAVRDVAPLTRWKGDPASTKRRYSRRFGVSRGCLTSPDSGLALAGPATNEHLPVQIPSPRPQPLATSLSRLNAFEPEADVVPYALPPSVA